MSIEATAPVFADAPVHGAFRPHPWTVGGHRQTLIGYWLRYRLRWSAPVEDVIVDAGDGVRLLLRASWQPRPRDRATLVLVHGLGGCDRGSYALSTGTLAWARGWNVVRMNMRGAGDGERICGHLYNAGLDTDLLAILNAVAERSARVAVAGFSLGGSLTLLTAGRCRERLPASLFGIATVSAPFDLAACAEQMEARENRAYHANYMFSLRRGYASRQRRLPELYEAGLERGTRTLREFDAAITARYGGYRDLADYYGRSSAGPWLTAIDRPTLALASGDDPLVPAASLLPWALSASVTRQILPTGGHVGFVAPTVAPGSFWAGERVMDFLESL